jgi:hypothetical protein
MEFLLEIFEDGRHKHIDNPFLGPCCQAGWDKLEKYYNKTGESCAYVAAVVLVPTCKWEFFEKGVTWREDWLRDARMAVQKVWEDEYRQVDPIFPTPRSQSHTDGRKENRFKTWSRQHIKLPEVIDEYKRYCKEPVIEMDSDEPFDPREWWQETTQRKVYPNLSKMVLRESVLQAVRVYSQRLSHRLEDHGSCNQAYQIIESDRL